MKTIVILVLTIFSIINAAGQTLKYGKKGVLDVVQNKQKEIESFKRTMDDFVSKFLLHES